MSDSELLAYLALQKVKQLGDILAKRLLLHFGSARAVFETSAAELQKVEGFGSRLINNLGSKEIFKLAEGELRFISDNGIQCAGILSEDYPERLRHCADGPILLFQKGRISIKNQPIISIVGTRRISSRGVAFCRDLIKYLAQYNPIIVSGFAYGTDITAQLTAMDHNLQTVACLAHGFEQIYPRPHAAYMNSIMGHGGFMSDFWSTDDFERTNFLKRNRIIAGLSEATIVIESATKGGSLVTADIANSYNREVFAVPGRVTDLMSEGCNNLIKTQQAHLLSDPQDIPMLLNWRTEKAIKSKPELPFPCLDAEEEKIYRYIIKNGSSFIDHIASGCELPVHTTASKLLSLELKDLIRPLSGKFFESANQ